MVTAVQSIDTYPHNWSIVANAGRSGRTAGAYLLGVVTVIAANGTSFVGFQLAHMRTSVAAAAGSDAEAGTIGKEDKEVIPAQVRRDMDETLPNTELS